MTRTTNSLGLLLGCLGLVQVICATYNLLTKWALTTGNVDPLMYCLYRDLCATPILLALAKYYDGPQPRPNRNELWRLFFLGLTGLFGNQVLFIFGLQRTSPFIASIVSQTQPVFSSVLAMGVGIEPRSPLILLGVVSAVIGAVVAVGGAGMLENTQVSSGLLLLLGGDLSMALYLIAQKPMLLSRRFSPLTITAYSYVFGTAQLLMMVGVSKRWWETATWALQPQTLVALSFAVVMNSVAKYGMYSFCNQELSVSTITLWGTLVPLLTALGDRVFFGTQFLERHGLGFGLICAGMAVNAHVKATYGEGKANDPDVGDALLSKPNTKMCVERERAV